MRAMITGLLLAAAPVAAAPLPPGSYTNEEDVYFAKDKGAVAPPWLGITVDAGGPHAIDAYGKPVAMPARVTLSPVDGGLSASWPDGRKSILRRARPATCWASVRKDKPKADGSEDWAFYPGLKLHDQGGRVLASGNGAQPVVLRLRNVVWPSGNNRPSFVLYVHKPENPDHAESYAWADPGAVRIGINLRWVQASCTIDGREKFTPALMGDKK